MSFACTLKNPFGITSVIPNVSTRSATNVRHPVNFLPLGQQPIGPLFETARNKNDMKLKELLSTTLVASTMLLAPQAIAQKVDEKHENHFKDIEPLETDAYSIAFQDVHCQMGFASAKVTITNKTTDYLLVDLSKVEFQFEWGNVKSGSGKELILDPKGSASKVVKVDGDNRFHVEAMKIAFNGVYTIPVNGTKLTGDDFRLPPKSNSQKVGSVTCSMGKMKKITDKTEVKFTAAYKGDKILLFDPSKITVKFPSGNEFANSASNTSLLSKSEASLMWPGKTRKFVVGSEEHRSEGDMQFIELNVVWNDAFIETEKVQAKVGTAVFEIDEAKTVGKNQ